MTELRIGIQTRSLRQPLRKALATSWELGADGVEIDARRELVPAQLSQTGLRQFRKLLENLNLRVSAIAFPTRRGYETPERLEQRVLATQDAMRLAYELRADVVINRVGQIPSSSDDPAYSRLVESLTALGAFGDRVGARLAAQTGSQSPAALARLLGDLPDGSIGVDLHPGALVMHGDSPAEAVAELGRHIIHVHATDAVRDFGAGRAVEVELGRGSADMPALLGQLTEFGYQGWVTIERNDSADPVGDIENAMAFLRAI